MQRLSYPTETDLSTKITENRNVLSFKDSPRKQLGRRPSVSVSSPFALAKCTCRSTRRFPGQKVKIGTCMLSLSLLSARSLLLQAEVEFWTKCLLLASIKFNPQLRRNWGTSGHSRISYFSSRRENITYQQTSSL